MLRQAILLGRNRYYLKGEQEELDHVLDVFEQTSAQVLTMCPQGPPDWMRFVLYTPEHAQTISRMCNAYGQLYFASLKGVELAVVLDQELKGRFPIGWIVFFRTHINSDVLESVVKASPSFQYSRLYEQEMSLVGMVSS